MLLKFPEDEDVDYSSDNKDHNDEYEICGFAVMAETFDTIHYVSWRSGQWIFHQTTKKKTDFAVVLD